MPAEVTIGEIRLSDPRPTEGDEVIITIPITNPGDAPIEVDLEVEVAGQIFGRQTVTVPAGGTVSVEVTIIAPADPTNVIVRVDDQRSHTRLDASSPRGIGLILGILIGIVATVIMLGVVAMVYLRRRIVVTT